MHRTSAPATPGTAPAPAPPPTAPTTGPGPDEGTDPAGTTDQSTADADGTEAPAAPGASSGTDDGRARPPRTPPGGTAARGHGATRHGAKKRGVDCRRKHVRCVALTFDDGPGPYTASLLRKLARAKVHATFFVVGANAARYPRLVRHEARQGHVVANHSWDHPLLTSLKRHAVDREIARTDRAVVRAGAPRPTLVRPPYGATDRKVRRALTHHDKAAVLWDVDTEDWKNLSSRRTTSLALKEVRSGSIILMHDIHPSSVRAVPHLVAALRKRGYTLVTVPELLGRTKPGKVYYRR
jgi:peptidoglycan/xylan/chitin deacetylase (PgdA/CDA1 family)